MASTKRTKTTKARTPRKAATKSPDRKRASTKAAKQKATKPAAPKKRERDPRLPAAGATLTREYKGRTIRVAVLEQGFRWERKEYRSLSALASAITGAKSINGFLWFKLTVPKAAKPKTGATAKPRERTKRPVAKPAAASAPEAATPAGA